MQENLVCFFCYFLQLVFFTGSRSATGASPSSHQQREVFHPGQLFGPLRGQTTTYGQIYCVNVKDVAVRQEN